MLWAIPIVALVTVFSAGVAMFCAAAQVYFRDLSSFLPYLLRIWLYISPILYYLGGGAQELPALAAAQPDVVDARVVERRAQRGPGADRRSPAVGLAWAVCSLLFGALFFISREREFAVRL